MEQPIIRCFNLKQAHNERTQLLDKLQKGFDQLAQGDHPQILEYIRDDPPSPGFDGRTNTDLYLQWVKFLITIQWRKAIRMKKALFVASSHSISMPNLAMKVIRVKEQHKRTQKSKHNKQTHKGHG